MASIMRTLAASFSVILNAMQVSLASDESIATASIASLTHVCFWFAILTILCACAIAGFLIALLIIMIIREAVFALKDLAKKRGSKVSSSC